MTTRASSSSVSPPSESWGNSAASSTAPTSSPVDRSLWLHVLEAVFLVERQRPICALTAPSRATRFSPYSTCAATTSSASEASRAAAALIASIASVDSSTEWSTAHVAAPPGPHSAAIRAARSDATSAALAQSALPAAEMAGKASSSTKLALSPSSDGATPEWSHTPPLRTDRPELSAMETAASVLTRMSPSSCHAAPTSGYISLALVGAPWSSSERGAHVWDDSHWQPASSASRTLMTRAVCSSSAFPLSVVCGNSATFAAAARSSLTDRPLRSHGLPSATRFERPAASAPSRAVSNSAHLSLTSLHAASTSSIPFSTSSLSVSSTPTTSFHASFERRPRSRIEKCACVRRRSPRLEMSGNSRPCLTAASRDAVLIALWSHLPPPWYLERLAPSSAMSFSSMTMPFSSLPISSRAAFIGPARREARLRVFAALRASLSRSWS
mmetsp:Transcript_87578/g.263290  ORF Transcript_87578/g.263290 Transcript_87578/m.263290 type:complete len:443 (+) Transcript_87578:530-1858(+)